MHIPNFRTNTHEEHAHIKCTFTVEGSSACIDGWPPLIYPSISSPGPPSMELHWSTYRSGPWLGDAFLSLFSERLRWHTKSNEYRWTRRDRRKYKIRCKYDLFCAWKTEHDFGQVLPRRQRQYLVRRCRGRKWEATSKKEDSLRPVAPC